MDAQDAQLILINNKKPVANNNCKKQTTLINDLVVNKSIRT